MTTIICGSRTFGYRPDIIAHVMQQVPWDVTAVITGSPSLISRRSIDDAGVSWAQTRNKPVKVFPAEWGVYGRSAGPRRNAEMAKHAGALVAVWDGQSRGTANMIMQARGRGLRVLVFRRATAGPA